MLFFYSLPNRFDYQNLINEEKLKVTDLLNEMLSNQKEYRVSTRLTLTC